MMDEFDTLDRWDPYTTVAVSPTTRNSMLVMAPPDDTAFMGLRSLTNRDRSSVRLTLVLTEVLSSPSGQVELGLTTDDDQDYVFAFIRDGRIGLQQQVGGLATEFYANDVSVEDGVTLMLETDGDQVRVLYALDGPDPVELPWVDAPDLVSDAEILVDIAAFEADEHGVMRADRFSECATGALRD